MKDVLVNKEKIVYLNVVSCKVCMVMEWEGFDVLVVIVCDNFYYLIGFVSFFMYIFWYIGVVVVIMFCDESILF